MAWTFSTDLKNDRANAILAKAGVGAKLSLWSVDYTTKLAEWTWTGNVWTTSTIGILAFIAPAVNPVAGSASGDAVIARLVKSDDTPVISDLTVGLAAANVIVSNVNIASGQNCNLISFTITEG